MIVAVIVQSSPMSERYKSTKVNNNKTDNNDKPESTIIYNLKQENKLLKYQLRKFQEGLNPILHSNQVQIIIDKQTWKRFKRFSYSRDAKGDNMAVNEILNLLLSYYNTKHAEERNKFERSAMQ